MGVAVLHFIENAIMVEAVDANLLRSVYDFAVGQNDSDVGNVACFVFEKCQVTGLGLLDEINQFPLVHLLFCRPQQVDAHQFEHHLGQSRGVDAQWGTPAPLVRRHQVTPGNLGDFFGRGLQVFGKNSLAAVPVRVVGKDKLDTVEIGQAGADGNRHGVFVHEQGLEQVEAVGVVFFENFCFFVGDQGELLTEHPANAVVPGTPHFRPLFAFPFHQFHQFAEQQLAQLLALVRGTAANGDDTQMAEGKIHVIKDAIFFQKKGKLAGIDN